MAGRALNRQLRKLGDDLPPAPADETESEEEDVPQRVPFNPFDLLTDDEVCTAIDRFCCNPPLTCAMQ